MSAASRTRDEWLALRCQSGDPAAFADLVAAMERPLLYYVVKITRRPDAALDVLQEVWMRAFRDVRKLVEPAALRAWLYRIAHGLAVDRVRQSETRARLEEEARALDATETEPSFAADDPAALHRALDALGAAHREVLLLHFIEEFSVAEIGSIVGCPEGTVKSRLHHAKRQLRAILQGDKDVANG